MFKKRDFFVFLVVMLILTPFMKIGLDKLNKAWATATRESSAIDAVPMSLYGNYNGTVKRVAVDSTGNMVVSGTSTGNLSLNTITANTVTANSVNVNGNIAIGGADERMSGSNANSSYIDFNDMGDGWTVVGEGIGIVSSEGTIHKKGYKSSSLADDGKFFVENSELKGSEIFLNNGFESTFSGAGTLKIPAGWYNQNMDEGSDTCDNEGTTIHSGLQSVHITVNASGEGIQQPVGLSTVPVGSYTLVSAWVYVVSGTVTLELDNNAAPNQAYEQVFSSKTGSWEKLSTIFYKPNLGGSQTQIMIRAYGGAAEFYVDDTSVKSVTPLDGFGTFSIGPERANFHWYKQLNDVLFDCETAFNEASVANVTSSANGTDYKTGSYSSQIDIDGNFTTGRVASKVIAKDMTGVTAMTLWIKSALACNSSDYRISVDDTANMASPTCSFELPALTANTWTEVSIIPYGSGGAGTGVNHSTGMNSIICLAIRQIVDKTANTLWLDDIRCDYGKIEGNGTTNSLFAQDTDAKVTAYMAGYLPVIKNRLGGAYEATSEATY